MEATILLTSLRCTTVLIRKLQTYLEHCLTSFYKLVKQSWMTYVDYFKFDPMIM